MQPQRQPPNSNTLMLHAVAHHSVVSILKDYQNNSTHSNKVQALKPIECDRMVGQEVNLQEHQISTHHLKDLSQTSKFAQSNIPCNLTGSSKLLEFTQHSESHLTENDESPHLTEHGESSHLTEHDESPHLTEHGESSHFTEHDESPHLTEHDKSVTLSKGSKFPKLSGGTFSETRESQTPITRSSLTECNKSTQLIENSLQGTVAHKSSQLTESNNYSVSHHVSQTIQKCYQPQPKALRFENSNNKSSQSTGCDSILKRVVGLQNPYMENQVAKSSFTVSCNERLGQSSKQLLKQTRLAKVTNRRQLKKEPVGLKSANPLVCKTCGVTFKKKLWLMKHRLKHGTFKCTECHLAFRTNSFLQKHQRREHKCMVGHGDEMKEGQSHQRNAVDERKASMSDEDERRNSIHSSNRRQDSVYNEGKRKGSVSSEGKRKGSVSNEDKRNGSVSMEDTILSSRTYNEDTCVRCEVCAKEFKGEEALKRHVLKHKKHVVEHNNDNLYKCTKCDKVFRRKGNLEKHVLFHDNGKSYQCDKCHKPFMRKRNLEKHECKSNQQSPNTDSNATTGSDKSFNVQTLKNAPNNKSAGTMHGSVKRHVNNKSTLIVNTLRCKTCGILFRSLVALQNHAVLHDKTYKCNDCHTSFERKGNLEKHNCTTPHKCRTCRRTFTRKTFLERHQCKEDKLYKCAQCHMSFRKDFNLERHQYTKHQALPTQTNNPLPLDCKICGKNFVSIQSLKNHEIIHVNVKSYNCKTCGKYFKKKGALKQHQLIIHVDLKSFSCKICEKDFKTKGALKQHQLIHSDNHRYKCKICRLQFRRKSSLQVHELAHKGQKPFRCLECGKRFTTRSYLEQHLKRGMHSSEGPFQCTLCDAKFKSITGFKLHSKGCGVKFNVTQIEQTNIEEFNCACGERFPSANDLMLHKVQHLNVNIFI